MLYGPSSSPRLMAIYWGRQLYRNCTVCLRINASILRLQTGSATRFSIKPQPRCYHSDLNDLNDLSIPGEFSGKCGNAPQNSQGDRHP